MCTALNTFSCFWNIVQKRTFHSLH
jgi:hypothetical protein